ncbi:MAG: hypothetical protein ACTSQV_05645, partial [Alphaproteobacteria bacterium]
LSVKTLLAQPVFPATGYTGQGGRGGHASQRDDAGDDAQRRFNAGPEPVAGDVAPPRKSKSQALTTPRDALYFRLQTETLPGPGSVAPYVAQQIGQLWIAPDARIGHSHAAAAYQRADQMGSRRGAFEPSIIA